MDATLVQEIANQMGMAVESTGQFLTDILPKYGMMNAITSAGWAVASLVGVIIGLVFLKIGIDKYKNSTCNYDAETGWYYGVAGSILAFICLLFMIGASVDAATWALFPDARLFGSIIKSL